MPGTFGALPQSVAVSFKASLRWRHWALCVHSFSSATSMNWRMKYSTSPRPSKWGVLNGLCATGGALGAPILSSVSASRFSTSPAPTPGLSALLARLAMSAGFYTATYWKFPVGHMDPTAATSVKAIARSVVPLRNNPARTLRPSNKCTHVYLGTGMYV